MAGIVAVMNSDPINEARKRANWERMKALGFVSEQGETVPLVKPHKCDGCYRPEQDPCGMWVIAAYTRQSNMVTRTVHGIAWHGLFKGYVYYRERGDAELDALRLNLRIG